MSLGTLVLVGLTRNPLRFFFAFAAIAAAFCLFGALETTRYQRDTPLSDESVIVVQGDSPGGFPLDYEATILAMQGVASATGVAVIPAVHPKSQTGELMVFGLNAAQIRTTFPGMKISAETAARWLDTRIGAIVYAPMAEALGWKPNDRVTIQLPPGFMTVSGSNHLEIILVGVYNGRSIIDGLIIRSDYLRAAFPFKDRLDNLFVRSARVSDAPAVASRIDQYFSAGASPTLSAQISDFRESSALGASTVRFLIRGALTISFFTLVFMVANAVTQSVRERQGEMAILQAIGFQERMILLLVFTEVAALFIAGAIVGLILANLGFAFEIAGMTFASAILPLHTIGWACFCVIVCAAIVAVVPTWELSRLQVADALRRL